MRASNVSTRFHRLSAQVGLVVVALVVLPGVVAASDIFPSTSSKSDGDAWRRLILLQDYNTRVVMTGTTLLGLAAGTIGSFTLLRRRALMGDALSHATLPGVGLAFLLAPVIGVDGKSLPLLLSGAAVSGLAGVGVIVFIRRMTRLKEDAALGIVLSVFFGAGMAILSLAFAAGGHAAGLESFIYGKTASMVAGDAWLIGISGVICVGIVVALFKELCLLCFDDGFAGSEGLSVTRLDMLLMALVVFVTIIGLQAVGAILMIALLVIPPAAARFWTHDLKRMTVIASGIGGLSGCLGAAVSAVIPGLPSGAMIVLICGGLFSVSMVAGPSRGIVARSVRRRQLNRRIDRDHLLRGLYETLEVHGLTEDERASLRTVPVDELMAIRSWSPQRLRQQINRSAKNGLVLLDSGNVALTAAGMKEAARLAHEHRLWELYLITHADTAPGHVDVCADTIEHVLDPQMIDRLEELLERHRDTDGIARSPHPLTASTKRDASESPNSFPADPPDHSNGSRT